MTQQNTTQQNTTQQTMEIDLARLLRIIGGKEYELDILKEHITLLRESLNKAEQKLVNNNKT